MKINEDHVADVREALGENFEEWVIPDPDDRPPWYQPETINFPGDGARLDFSDYGVDVSVLLGDPPMHLMQELLKQRPSDALGVPAAMARAYVVRIDGNEADVLRLFGAQRPPENTTVARWLDWIKKMHQSVFHRLIQGATWLGEDTKEKAIKGNSVKPSELLSKAT